MLKYILMFLLYLYLGTGFFIGVRVKKNFRIMYKGEKFNTAVQIASDIITTIFTLILETVCWLPIILSDMIESKSEAYIKKIKNE